MGGRSRAWCGGCCAGSWCWASLGCGTGCGGFRTSLRRRCPLGFRSTLLGLRSCALGFYGALLRLRRYPLRFYGALLLLLWSCTLRFDGTLLLLLRCHPLRFNCALLLLGSDGAVGFDCALLLGFGCAVGFYPALLLWRDAGAVFRGGGALLLGLDVVLLDGDAALLLLADGCGSFRDVRSAGGNASRTSEGCLRRAAVVVVEELRAVL